MLPFDEKKTPTTVVDSGSDDLMKTAKKRALGRIMAAFKDSNIDQAYEAFEDLIELCEAGESY